MVSQAIDPLVLGRRVRHFRRAAGLTLDDLGEVVGKPAPYLSLLENGKKEPRVNLVADLADAVGVDLGQLLDNRAPSRRDELEISLLRSQQTTLFESYDLPTVKPTTKMSDDLLTHLVGMHEALRERSTISSAGADEVRRANGDLHHELTTRHGYLSEIEAAAEDALEVSGYAGDGPFSSRNLLDLTASSGFELAPIDDMPGFARSIVDTKTNRIYIAQRNELRTRQARKAVLQTIAGFVLSHETEPDLATFLRQRMETAYFATAVLAPERSVVARMQTAKANHDLDVEDVKELFYVSYEMAAWRMANLVTEHFGIDCHIIVGDDLGAVVKGYSNDGVPVPRDEYGGMETQRICARWGPRVALESSGRFATHHQYTDTPGGTYFSTTHVEAGRDPAHTITLGVPFAQARWFRGRDTQNRNSSTCPDPVCCQAPPADLAEAWDGSVIVSARSQERILGLMAADPYPTIEMPDVFRMVDRHADE